MAPHHATESIPASDHQLVLQASQGYLPHKYISKYKIGILRGKSGAPVWAVEIALIRQLVSVYVQALPERMLGSSRDQNIYDDVPSTV